MTLSSETESPVRPPARARVLFQLSGSIAAYKACHVVSRLVQAGYEVQTVATASALEFVGEATLEGLTGRPVATDVFARGRAMDHIHLVRWADLVVLCPASANTINRLAAGLGDDLISTMFLAHDFDKPYLIAPAMNATMYRHPATRRSLGQLRTWGVEVLEPGSGQLACGEVGAGRLLEPERILDALVERLDRLELHRDAAESLRAAEDPHAAEDLHAAEQPHAVWPAARSGARHRFLVTAGGTAVPIDGVRTITNTSTGATGSAIAAHLAGAGHSVTLVHARTALLPPRQLTDADEIVSDTSGRIRLVPFTTFTELDEVLRHELATGAYDAVIHLAAVSDFDVDHLVVDGKEIVPNPLGKIDSGETLTIHLRKNHKILSRLGQYASPSNAGSNRLATSHPLIVVGFKLTNGATPAERLQAVARVTPGTDFIVHNDIAEMDSDCHPATIFRNGHACRTVTTKRELAQQLEQLIAARLTELTGRSIVDGQEHRA